MRAPGSPWRRPSIPVARKIDEKTAIVGRMGRCKKVSWKNPGDPKYGVRMDDSRSTKG